jgi:hypothetical protein
VAVGDVLSEALDLYQRFFRRFVLIAASVFVLVDLLAAIAADARGGSRPVFALWTLVYVLIALVGAFWVQGALVAAVQDARDGKLDRKIGDLYDSVRPRLPALIAAGVLAGVGAGIGLVLFVVPGLILLTRWILIAPVIVLEGRRASEAFKRSAELVKGNGRPVFGVIVSTLLIGIVAHGVLIRIFAFLPAFAANWAGGLLADSLVTPFVALSWTVMYFQLSQKSKAA